MAGCFNPSRLFFEHRGESLHVGPVGKGREWKDHRRSPFGEKEEMTGIRLDAKGRSLGNVDRNAADRAFEMTIGKADLSRPDEMTPRRA